MCWQLIKHCNTLWVGPGSGRRPTRPNSWALEPTRRLQQAFINYHPTFKTTNICMQAMNAHGTIANVSMVPCITYHVWTLNNWTLIHASIPINWTLPSIDWSWELVGSKFPFWLVWSMFWWLAGVPSLSEAVLGLSQVHVSFCWLCQCEPELRFKLIELLITSWYVLVLAGWHLEIFVCNGHHAFTYVNWYIKILTILWFFRFIFVVTNTDRKASRFSGIIGS